MTHLSTSRLLNFSPLLLSTFISFISAPQAISALPEKSFRFHLLAEPVSLDPARLSSAAGTYLFQNLFRGLYRYSSKTGLILEGARECKTQGLKFTCKLNEKQRWSNGKPVVAADYVRAWRHLFDPNIKAVQSELLLNVKNAKDILAGKMKPEQLAVTALDPLTLQVEFVTPDPEFSFRLISPSLAPIFSEEFPDLKHARDLVSNGPYQLEEWSKAQRIRLRPNPHYPENQKRPTVEALLIDEDSTALRLYESDRLNFLRRLVTAEIPSHQNSPEFHQVPMARFDYVGFGPQITDSKVREAFSLALNYAEISKLFFSLGQFGCPSLTRNLVDQLTCYSLDVEKAKSLWAQLPESWRHRKWRMGFSKQGGEDISRQVEWMQGQWQKNLGVKVELESLEQSAYFKRLKNSPPDIFRRGVSADRPTCLGAIEVFVSDHAENFTHFNSKEFDQQVARMRNSTQLAADPKECRKAVDILMEAHVMIPLGEMHFTLLARRQFTGWELNSLNQLDLTDLRWVGQ